MTYRNPKKRLDPKRFRFSRCEQIRRARRQIGACLVTA